VGGVTALQGFDLLQRDPETKVIVLISKPPDPEVASKLLQNARTAGKPVVINFIGYSSYSTKGTADNLYFSSSLDEVAELAVELSNSTEQIAPAAKPIPFDKGNKYLRGIYSGGTLAYESLLVLQNFLPAVYSNIPLKKENKLPDSRESKDHTIIDLGEDEFTRGRPHPMLDNTLRIERLKREAADPEVAIILMDVVLGYGAHPDPASELAPIISDAISSAKKAGRDLEVIVILVGTDEDPQDLTSQLEQFRKAGARVEKSCSAVVIYAGERLQTYPNGRELPQVDLSILTKPVEAINVGLESFTKSLVSQNVPVIHVDWRPPAGGNEKLISILERLKNK
jgi:FdrA protein